MAFNSRMLDASILAACSYLSNEQKIGVLLDALQLIQFDSHSRVVIENAAESCLRISTDPVHLAQARSLRAKVGLCDGLPMSLDAAQQDLQPAPSVDSNNQETGALIQVEPSCSHDKVSVFPRTGAERFSSEIWLEIARFLTRRDQRTLLFVPCVPSRAASRLLFRRIDLHFVGPHSTHEKFASEDEASHGQRNADILTQIILEPRFACLIRSLRIFGSYDDMAFPAGMLKNAMSNLINLSDVHCSASGEGLKLLLRALFPASSQLRRLSLKISGRSTNLPLLGFKNLTHITCKNEAGSVEQMGPFITQNQHTLRSIKLDTGFPQLPYIFGPQNLTFLDVCCCVADVQIFCDMFRHWHQLEYLAINCILSCSLSPQLRTIQACLPVLKHFAFTVSSVDHSITDRDLFPALVELLRNRTELKTLRLSVPEVDRQQRVGFDASTWGLLPSLVNLTSLAMTYPRDLPPTLASWLIPRSVRALTINGMSFIQDSFVFLNQLRAGLPPGLRFIGIASSSVFPNSFPSTVRVLQIGNKYGVIVWKEDGSITEFQKWPKGMVDRHLSELLEYHECEEALGGEYSL